MGTGARYVGGGELGLAMQKQPRRNSVKGNHSGELLSRDNPVGLRE